jgi:hypothetical protein
MRRQAGLPYPECQGPHAQRKPHTVAFVAMHKAQEHFGPLQLVLQDSVLLEWLYKACGVAQMGYA